MRPKLTRFIALAPAAGAALVTVGAYCDADAPTDTAQAPPHTPPPPADHLRRTCGQRGDPAGRTRRSRSNRGVEAMMRGVTAGASEQERAALSLAERYAASLALSLGGPDTAIGPLRMLVAAEASGRLLGRAGAPGRGGRGRERDTGHDRGRRKPARGRGLPGPLPGDVPKPWTDHGP